MLSLKTKITLATVLLQVYRVLGVHVSSFRPLPRASLSWRATQSRMSSVKTKINLCDSTTTGLQSLRCARVFFQAFAVCKFLLEGYPEQNVICKN